LYRTQTIRFRISPTFLQKRIDVEGRPMMTPVQRCSICGGTFTGYGNDSAPVV
jgi:hypothetical protein